jgi:hypothetical protein
MLLSEALLRFLLGIKATLGYQNVNDERNTSAKQTNSF